MADCGQQASANTVLRGRRIAAVWKSLASYASSTYVPDRVLVAQPGGTYLRNNGSEHGGKDAVARSSPVGHKNRRDFSCCVTTRDTGVSDEVAGPES